MDKTLAVGLTGWTTRQGWRAAELSRQAEQAESLGFHSFWLPENHFGDQRSLPSPLTLLAAAAASTRRIRLATTSYLLPIRHPLLAAEEVAVLDQLCEGRVILGVGRGIQGEVFRAFDLPASDKRKRFRSNLDLMRRAWAGEAIAGATGDDPVHLAPLPVQQPHPPIWVAAFGPLALQQAGKLGLPYLASPIESLATLEHNYRRYRQALAEAGQRPVATVPLMRTLLITDSAKRAQEVGEALQRRVPAAMRERAGALADWAVVGDVDYVRDKLAEYRQRLGMSHLVVRGGLPGVSQQEQWRSHEQLLAMAGELP